MNHVLLTGIAALFLTTGTAHAADGQLIGAWDCSGIRVELRKHSVHFHQIMIRGEYPVNPLRTNVRELKDGNITFNGKRCKATDEPEDWVDK